MRHERFCASITGFGFTTNPTSSRVVETDIQDSNHEHSRRDGGNQEVLLMRASYLFTSESVSEGHPDKVCDRISDEIVDLVYREAKKAGMNAWDVRVACETLATTNRVVIAGEVRVPHTLLKKDKDGNPLKDANGHPVIN